MTETALQKKYTGLRDLLAQSREAIEQVLPKHLTPERMMRIGLTALRTTPGLMDCTPASFVAAMIEASRLGLEPDNVLGHAYLIPFGKQVVLMPGYKGYIDLVYRAGEVGSLYPYLVYEKEPFQISYGTSPGIHHKPLPPDKRGDIIGAYAVAHFRDKRAPVFEFMWLEEMDKIRDKSAAKTKKDSPWNTWPEQMYRKTVLRRISNYLKLSPELAQAVRLDQLAEAGEPQRLDLGNDIIDTSSEAVKQATEQRQAHLRDNLNLPAHDDTSEETPEPLILANAMQQEQIKALVETSTLEAEAKKESLAMLVPDLTFKEARTIIDYLREHQEKQEGLPV